MQLQATIDRMAATQDALTRVRDGIESAIDDIVLRMTQVGYADVLAEMQLKKHKIGSFSNIFWIQLLENFGCGNCSKVLGVAA